MQNTIKKKLKLEMELVPASAHYKNVRSNLSKIEWDILRRACYKKANNRCEICNGVGDRWPVEAHEVWKYNLKTKVQKLERLIALCQLCHSVKHFGLAQLQGRDEIAKKHFLKVNKCSVKVFEKHKEKSFALYEKRSQEDWTLDLDFLLTKREKDYYGKK